VHLMCIVDSQATLFRGGRGAAFLPFLIRQNHRAPTSRSSPSLRFCQTLAHMCSCYHSLRPFSYRIQLLWSAFIYISTQSIHFSYQRIRAVVFSSVARPGTSPYCRWAGIFIPHYCRLLVSIDLFLFPDVCTKPFLPFATRTIP